MCLVCVEIGNVAELYATRLSPLFHEILMVFVYRAGTFEKITFLESVLFSGAKNRSEEKWKDIY